MRCLSWATHSNVYDGLNFEHVLNADSNFYLGGGVSRGTPVGPDERTNGMAPSRPRKSA